MDLKPLNKRVPKKPFTILKVSDTLVLVSGATLFSKLDANSGFCPAKDSRPFTTPFGRYHFNKPSLRSLVLLNSAKKKDEPGCRTKIGLTKAQMS